MGSSTLPPYRESEESWNTTTAEIAAAKNAAIIMSFPLAAFVGKKVDAIRNAPTPPCPQAGDDVVAPFDRTCLAGIHIGGMRPVKVNKDARAVEITVVMAAHDNTVPRSLLSEALRKSMDADNVSLMLGPATGYIVKFTNGLTVYLSGDTGLHADMKVLNNEFHKVNLMVLNLGYSAITAQAGAHAANELVKPASVIVTHVNEAATVNGKVRPTSHTADFIGLVKGRPVYPALSGKTMEFDGAGKCIAGCG
ncbi:MAG: hypothetical protein ABIO63_03520 [Casimicrobiaceae bacterium]